MSNHHETSLNILVLVTFLFSLIFFQACTENTREFTCDKKYLNLPVKNGGERRHLEFFVDGEKVCEYESEFSVNSGYFGLYGFYVGKAFDNVKIYSKGNGTCR